MKLTKEFMRDIDNQRGGIILVKPKDVINGDETTVTRLTRISNRSNYLETSLKSFGLYSAVMKADIDEYTNTVINDGKRMAIIVPKHISNFKMDYVKNTYKAFKR